LWKEEGGSQARSVWSSRPARSGMSQLYFPVFFSFVCHSMRGLGFSPLGGRRSEVGLKYSPEFCFRGFISRGDVHRFYFPGGSEWGGATCPGVRWNGTLGCVSAPGGRILPQRSGERGSGFFSAPGDPGGGLLPVFPCSLPGGGLTGEWGNLW
jgi:hypothetical protein